MNEDVVEILSLEDTEPVELVESEDWPEPDLNWGHEETDVEGNVEWEGDA